MDRYTKTILTIIAAALTTIVLQNVGVAAASGHDTDYRVDKNVVTVLICNGLSGSYKKCAGVTDDNKLMVSLK